MGIAIFVAATLLLLILYRRGNFDIFHKSWKSFTTYGGVRGNVIDIGKKIIYGTDYSKLNILDINNRYKLQTFDLNNGTPNPQYADNNFVYVVSADTLWKIDYRKSAIVWKFTTERSYTLERSICVGNKVFAGASDGSFYVVNKLTGKLIWSIPGTLPANSASRTVGNNVYLGPDFWVKDKYVYLADRAGNFYALDINSGKVAWKYNIESTIIGNFSIYKGRIYIFSSDKKVYSVDLRTGKTIFIKDTEQQIICADIYKGRLIEQGDLGQLFSRNLQNGNLIWKSESFGKGLMCPPNYNNDGVFSRDIGEVIRVDLNTGETKWINKGLGQTNLSLMKVSRGLFGANYIYSGLDGRVWSINGKGVVNWVFDAHSPIYSLPITVGKNLIIGTSGAEFYKINKFSGRNNTIIDIFEFNTSLEKTHIGQDDIVEINLKSNSIFNNPWNEGYLSALFSGPSGKGIFVDGFYYDNNIWKIRFNPPETGEWKYDLTWDDHGSVYHRQGKFTSTTDSSNSYIKISKDNPKRLTLDNKNIFNMVGWQQSVIDFNNNGSPLDDWTTGIGAPLASTTSSYIDSSVSAKLNWVNLDEFINVYGPKGAGFNVFRYGVNNATVSPYNELLHPPIYSISNGKTMDELFINLRENDIHVWFTLFGFGMPYSLDLSDSNKYLFESYIRYIIARYGAYVDIWELFNEYEAPGYIKEFLIGEINKYDYLKKPITTSPEDFGTPGIDIISPHWYETELLSQSSKATYDYINHFAKYNKPVIFGEQGNAIFNWTPDSATRMRVRLWTAFMNNGAMVFWSNSSVRGLKQTPPFFANIFIGDEERLYVKNLQQFTYPVSLKAAPIKINLENKSIIGYGLVSEEQFLGYFVNTDKNRTTKNIQTELSLPISGTLEWYDPKTGETVGRTECQRSVCLVKSPDFDTDIAVKLIKH